MMMMPSDRALRPTSERNVNFVKKSVIDVGVLLVLVGIACAVHFGMPVLKNGYFCGDTSIRYPYKPETVSTVSLYLLALGFPIIFLGMGEILFANEEDYEGDARHHVFKWQVPKAFVRTYDITISFLFGFAVCVVVVIMSRKALGVMRPNFIAVCEPSPAECTHGIDLFLYRHNFTCANPQDEEYARVSFPSKHATLCFYSMVYLAVYLQNKVRWEYLSVFNNIMQLTFLIVAWIVSITQITDNFSHMSDVIAGIVIGSFVAWYNICAVYNFFLSGVRMQNPADQK